MLRVAFWRQSFHLWEDQTSLDWRRRPASVGGIFCDDAGREIALSMP